MTSQTGASVDALSDLTLEKYPSGPLSKRLVGREIEIPLVDEQGEAASVAALWPALLDLPDSRVVHDEDTDLVEGVQRPYGFVSVEFGRGVVEVALNPEPDLAALERSAEVALAELRAAAEPSGARLLGLGMQPRAATSREEMTPKRRYLKLLDQLGERALCWTGTAADQVHVDVSREELLPALNAVNGFAGAIIALSANSPLRHGRPAAAQATREHLAANVFTEPHRWGATPRRLESLEEYVAYVLSFAPIEEPDAGLGEWERFVELDHLVWPNGRAVFRFGTVEVRPACQQPFDSFWVPSALGLGLVANAAEADAWLAERGEWEQLLAYRERAIAAGLAAEEPWPGFVRGALELAEAGLRRRGAGEERFLADAWERLERRRSPADEALELVEKEGFDGLVRARGL
ncbi:MAG TPA: glutamate-cysteine ligase family protein [Solirubrobacterales bacterium]|nr:glutamate-cysteine ligase family protein [Solirubrobacterales bacterium]